MIFKKAIFELTNSEIDLCNNLLITSQDKHIFNDIRLHLRIQDYYKNTVEGNVLFFSSNGNITAYIIIYHIIGKKLINYFSPYQKTLITYGGIVCSEGRSQQKIYLKELKKFLRRRAIYIKSIPGIDISIYRELGFKIKEKQTLYINTQKSEKELWDGIKNRIQWNIKKGYQSNIRVDVIIPKIIEDIEPLYEIYSELCARTGLYLHSKSYYFSILDNNNYEHSLIFYAYKEEQVVSAMAVLQFDEIIISWFGGTFIKYRNTNAASLIYWEIIKYACSHNLECFDLLGLDIQNIAFFKKGFGGYELPVYHISYNSFSYKVVNKIRKLIGR
jgi:lipid II:glycine glycyltransferase (peptidoglycan interpeptide bridge formation enzyme)